MAKRSPPLLRACSGKVTWRPGSDSQAARLVCDRALQPAPARYQIPSADGSKALVLEPPAGSYTTRSEPCKTDRKGCPVQLFFRESVPYVRFCQKAGSGEPGWVVPAKSPEHARKLAAKACSAWKRGKRFGPTNPAVVESGGTLGRLRRR